MPTTLPFGLPLYCERLGDGPWAEPLNAVSNAAFFIAALVAFVHWRQKGGTDRPALVLILIAAMVGVGSLAWHTFRSPMTLIMDVVPIQIFVFGYFILALRRFFTLGWPVTGLFLGLFLAITLAVKHFVPTSTLAGGAQYIPALITLYLFGAALVIETRISMHRDMPLTGRAAATSDARHFPRLKAGYALLYAGLVFALSLTARTLDLPFCPQFGLGLHFFWHILNGVTMAMLLLAAIQHGPQQQSS